MVAPLRADIERELARVWLRKVIGPIVEGLANEHVRLERGSVGFRAVDRRLEHVVRIEEMVAVSQRPNLEQFLRLQDPGLDLQRDFGIHDTLVGELEGAAAVAFDKLIASTAFATLTTTVPTKRRALAEYVVNGVDRLPDYYELYADWEQLGDQLCALKTVEPMRTGFHALEVLRSSLGLEVGRLEQQMYAVRDKLADRYLLPVVDQDVL